MVGRYSALLLQIKDNRPWNEEVDTSLVKKLGEAALVKLIPVWEPQLTVAEWDNDRQSETFGQPKMFNFNEQPVGDEAFVGPTRGEPVHPSRGNPGSAKVQRMTTFCRVSRRLRPDTTKGSTLRRFPAVALRAS